jgi:hypothetical protein
MSTATHQMPAERREPAAEAAVLVDRADLDERRERLVHARQAATRQHGAFGGQRAVSEATCLHHTAAATLTWAGRAPPAGSS